MPFEWIKAFHVIAMTAWFAGLFYLPRLFVYHAACEDTLGNERFKIMERKLYYYIMTPAALLTTFLGIGLVSFNAGGYLHLRWFLAKLTLVGFLWGYHVYCGYLLKQFKIDKNPYSSGFYRFFNEFPTLILIGVVVLVYIRPF